MAVSIMLVDGGFGPSLEDWPAIRDQVLADLGARFQPDVVRFADSEVNNFSDTSRRAKDPRVGCHVSVSLPNIDHLLCRLLFELAERARLFIVIADQPEFLRPPSLRGADLERGGLPIGDIDSSEALFLYFQPAHGSV